jgi:hypothetical protein
VKPHINSVEVHPQLSKGTDFETSFGDLPCRLASSPKKEMRCDFDLRTTFEGVRVNAVSAEGDLD